VPITSISFTAPKGLGLKSNRRRFGTGVRSVFDYVIRRLNALSAWAEKPGGEA